MKKNILLPLLIFSLWGCSKEHEENSVHPNIVIVLTDDLGYGDVSIYNSESKIQTPNIDALAKQGIWFTDAHSPASICSPSRYSMLTGRYAWRNPSLRKGVLMPWDPPEIDSKTLTIPSFLKAAGYATACIGKWHLGFNWPWAEGFSRDKARRGGNSIATVDMFDWAKPITGGPVDVGFDYYYGDDVINFPPFAFIENQRLTCDPVDIKTNDLVSFGARGHIHGNGPGQQGFSFEQVLPEITDKAVNYIRKMSSQDTPFFLYFSTTSPHTPVVPIKKFQGKSDAGYYGDFVVQTDDAIGQIIKVLKENNCFDNTLLIVTSDNGPCPNSEKVNMEYNHYAAAGWRGIKFDSWEGGHRIPFVVSWPNGGLEGGRKNEQLISLTDIFATLANLVGYELPEDCAEDSYNIITTLMDNNSVREELVIQNGKGNLGLRSNNWVYLEGSGGNKEPDWRIERLNIQSPDTTIQLFDLAVDPGQKINLKDKYPEKVKELQKRLSEIKLSNKTR